MDREVTTTFFTARAADIRALMIFYALVHAALLVVLGFGGSGLEDSGTQLALAALAAITTLFTVGFIDDAMQDLYAAGQDIAEEGFGEKVRGRFDAWNMTVFRLANVVMFGLILVAELLAIY